MVNLVNQVGKWLTGALIPKLSRMELLVAIPMVPEHMVSAIHCITLCHAGEYTVHQCGYIVLQIILQDILHWIIQCSSLNVSSGTLYYTLYYTPPYSVGHCMFGVGNCITSSNTVYW